MARKNLKRLEKHCTLQQPDKPDNYLMSKEVPEPGLSFAIFHGKCSHQLIMFLSLEWPSTNQPNILC